MKKIFGLLAFLMVLVTVSAQNLNYNETYFSKQISTATDVVTTGDSLWSYTVTKKMDAKCNVYVDMAIEKTAGTSDTAWIYLETKMFPLQSWVKVDSVMWNGQGTKTIFFSPDTLVYSGVSDSTYLVNRIEPKLYSANEFWRVSYIGTSDSFTAYIRRLNFKFIKD